MLCWVVGTERTLKRFFFFSLDFHPSHKLLTAFKLTHILQKFKEKSKRKSEHMTLLKDMPQPALCNGFA